MASTKGYDTGSAANYRPYCKSCLVSSDEPSAGSFQIK